MLLRVVVLFVFTVACSPLRDAYLEEVSQNFTDQGFIDIDVFQVLCDVEMQSKPLMALQEQLEKKCADKILVELVTFHYSYTRHISEVPDDENVEYSISVDLEKKDAILSYYPELKTAKMVLEKNDGQYLSGVYRIEQAKLYEELTDRPFRLVVKNIPQKKSIITR